MWARLAASLHGAGPESKVFLMESTGKNKVVYTYGWYLRKFVMDALEKGATPIIVSHTPRNKWHSGRIESNKDDFGCGPARLLCSRARTSCISTQSRAKSLQSLGQGNTGRYFKHDHTHTSLEGARLNAAAIAEGLRAADCPLKEYLKA